MTTQDRFIDYGTLPTGIPRVLHQFMLGINTAMPGEVVRYADVALEEGFLPALRREQDRLTA